jgi:hypothetical protein
MSKKLDLFADKEYQDMDWLGKAIEPFIFPLNDNLAMIPDKWTFTIDDLMPFVVSKNETLNKMRLLSICLEKNDLKMSKEDCFRLLSLFDVEIVDLTINLLTRDMTGSLTLVKKVPFLDEEAIKTYLSAQTYTALGHMNSASLHRCNEVMDIIGMSDDPTRKSRSPYGKMRAIQRHMAKVIEEDQWRLRSAPLIERVSYWIVDFINNGNLASLSNVTRLKCMTYSGKPIYSLEETV